jgi:hypothetical protein
LEAPEEKWRNQREICNLLNFELFKSQKKKKNLPLLILPTKLMETFRTETKCLVGEVSEYLTYFLNVIREIGCICPPNGFPGKDFRVSLFKAGQRR